MVERDRHDRTARLLETRLEAIARVSERRLGRSASLESEVVRAAVATRHAIELELLSPEEAGAIWAAVARRHPTARFVRRGFERTAA